MCMKLSVRFWAVVMLDSISKNLLLFVHSQSQANQNITDNQIGFGTIDITEMGLLMNKLFQQD